MVASRSLLALAGWGVSVATAVELYVTELAVFSDLVPCAKAAVSGVIDYQTVSSCPEQEGADLRSCICSKRAGANLFTVSNSISLSVSYTCGSTATDDQASAATVLSAYCKQDLITSFPSPSYTVSDYIVDLSAYHDLAPCAQSGVSAAVLGLTWDQCQEDASLLATCACKKNDNSQSVSEQVKSSIDFYCSGHKADVRSGQAVFAGYCGLVDGTTSFPETTDPPGDVTYQITDLREFKSLASCAQMPVSYYVLHQTDDLCPSGAKALASCACLRSEMTASISSLITSDVRYYCSSAAEDISSALDVWNLYCSAAKGLTTPAGVPQATNPPSSGTRTDGVQETGKSDSSDNDGDGSMSTSTAVIAGAVVGAVVGTALIALVAFLLYRRSKKAQTAASAPAVPDAGKPELDSTAIVAPTSGSPSPSITKNEMIGSSPVSVLSSPYAVPSAAELHNQRPRTPVLQSPDAPSPQTPHEAHSQQVYEAPGQFRPPVPGHQGMGWQSGPIPNAYEMDGTSARN